MSAHVWNSGRKRAAPFVHVVIYESKEVEKDSLMRVTVVYPKGRVED